MPPGGRNPIASLPHLPLLAFLFLLDDTHICISCTVLKKTPSSIFPHLPLLAFLFLAPPDSTQWRKVKCKFASYWAGDLMTHICKYNPIVPSPFLPLLVMLLLSVALF